MGLLLCLILETHAQRVRRVFPTLRTRATVRDSVRADSVKRRLLQIDQRKLLDSIRSLSRRRTILGRAASVVFDFRDRREHDRGIDAALLDRQYDRHNYKIVRHVEYTRLDPFGYSIDNLTRHPVHFWEKAGNAVHITTHRGVVRRSLLFRPGEALEPQALTDSERLLRATPYIGDARVMVNEATSTDDSVDVIVITKDVFSIGFGAAAAPGSPIVNTRLLDNNILGLGHQLDLGYSTGHDRPDPARINASYAVASIGRNFLQGRAQYRSEYGFRNAGIGLERGFITPTTRWAGAVRLDAYDELVGRFGVVSAKDPPVLPRTLFAVQDLWLGRSYALRTYDLERTNHARLITAGRVVNTTFARRAPEQLRLENRWLNDRTLVLGSVGLSFRRYYKDRYLFGFGRTEDIPAGNLVSLTAGYEYSSLSKRPYVATRFALGHYRKRFGYLYSSTELSSYRRAGRWEQGLLTAEGLYFTPLAYLGTWQWRQFFWLRTSLGYRRDPLELLTINKDDGLRGFASGVLRGQRRVVLNYESTLFTPVSFLGFRLATIVFADVAWLSPDGHTSPFRSAPYAGVGMGLRFRNDYIAFRTIQVLLGYYPRLPPGESLQQLRIYEAARPFVSFRDFGFSQPAVSDFR